MSRENSPLICAYKIFMNTKYTYIYLKLLTEFSLQVEIEAYKIQDIYMIWTLAWLAQPHNHKMNIKDKSSTNYHSSSHITSQKFKSKHKSQTDQP